MLTLGSVLKRCIMIWRASGLVEPSRRMYTWPCRFRNASSRSSILAICVRVCVVVIITGDRQLEGC